MFKTIISSIHVIHLHTYYILSIPYLFDIVKTKVYLEIKQKGAGKSSGCEKRGLYVPPRVRRSLCCFYHGILGVTNLKLLSQTENNFMSFRKQFIVLFMQFLISHYKKDINYQPKKELIPSSLQNL